MIKNKFPIIFIMGHTLTGKTDFVIELKNKYPIIQIISVDSVSIYREMDIGSAKPNKFILNKFDHKLINIRDPIQTYSVFDFYKDSINIINKSHINNKIPVLVGGTMFYFKKLLHGLNNFYRMDIKLINKFIKKKISYLNKLEILSIINNLNLLYKKEIHPNNIFKLIKTIRILIIQGFIKNEIYNLKNKFNIYQYCFVNKDEYEIKKKIKCRFLKMLSSGFEKEVNNLYIRGDLNINMQSIKSIGYKEMWLYFLKKISYNEMINKSILSTLNLIKYQTNWIKSWDSDLEIIENDQISKKKIFNKISSIINNYDSKL